MCRKFQNSERKIKMKRILISCESLVLHQGYEVTGCVTEKLRIPREHCNYWQVQSLIISLLLFKDGFLCLIAMASLTLRLMVLIRTFTLFGWILWPVAWCPEKQFVISIVAWLPRLNLYSKNKFGAAFEADDIVSYYIVTHRTKTS